MHQIYRELEDRAFEVLNPHRATILRKAIDKATKGSKTVTPVFTWVLLIGRPVLKSSRIPNNFTFVHIPKRTLGFKHIKKYAFEISNHLG